MTEWNNLDLPKDQESLATIAKCSPERFAAVWQKIQHKFTDNGAGRFINVKTEETRQKVYKKSFHTSNAGKAARSKAFDNIEYPWNTVAFKEKWEYWKKYKKDTFRFSYKTPMSEQGALKALTKLTSSEADAIDLIQNAIDRQWQGIYLPHDWNKKKTTKIIESNKNMGSL